ARPPRRGRRGSSLQLVVAVLASFGGSTAADAQANRPTQASIAPARQVQETAYFPLPDAQGGWRTLRGADEIRRVAGMDQQKLDEAFAFIQGSTKHGGLVVLRKGWLVYENYFGLGHREATPNLASCGKSFTSIAVGILMSERPELFPDVLDQKVFTPRYFPAEAFPLADPRKADISAPELLHHENPESINHEC
ncbi:MAG: hypothetical protein ACREF9_04825, partial [Opitutaceae bacterium]